jgi:hypothetical protein
VMNKGAVKMLGTRNLLSANKQGMRYMASGGPVAAGGYLDHIPDWIKESIRMGSFINVAGDKGQGAAERGIYKWNTNVIDDSSKVIDDNSKDGIYKWNTNLMNGQSNIARMAMVNPYTLSGASGGSSAGMSEATGQAILSAIRNQPNKVLAPAWEMQTWKQQANAAEAVRMF